MKLENTLKNLLLDLNEPYGLHPSENLTFNTLDKLNKKNLLMKFKEFNNIKKINILKEPYFKLEGDKFTYPEKHEINFDFKTNNNGNETTITPDITYPDGFEETISICINEESKNIFNDVVDLFSISLTPKLYNDKTLTEGVYITPVNYSPIDLTPLKEVKIIFSPEKIQDKVNNGDILEDIINELINKAKELIHKNSESNIPFTQDVIIRCSKRSINELR